MTGGELPLWVTVPGSLLLVAAGLLVLVGGIGLLRLPDFFARMHPPTMGASLGAGCVLIASMLVSAALLDRPVVHELLITLFVIVTTPVTAMLLVRAGRHRQRAESSRRSAQERSP
ncbi:MAG TPA: monovalent cation/H(+) antiporter subunit G [Woeseiaceae bacterium]|nr:monovalent cation/H(+) antiporter subunit G [Woeseiaceae bacterium]